MTDNTSFPDLALIAAMDRNLLIGKNGKMPWHIPEDLAWFKECTLGHIVIMGRRTWWSLRHPLPDRENIVLSRDPGFEAKGAIVLHGITDLLRYCGARRAFVIGGAEIFRQFIPLATSFYQSLIDAEFEGDTWFPDWQPQLWLLESTHSLQSSAGPMLHFNIYHKKRINPPAK